MLSKLIKLEDIRDDFDKADNSVDIRFVIGDFMQVTIEAFKTLTDEVIRLKAKVKKLQQQDSYYPNEEEIRNIKVGLTD